MQDKLKAPLLQLLLIEKPHSKHNVASRFERKNGQLHWWAEGSVKGERNLLEREEGSFVYLVLIAAIVRALHKHAPLLWASVASVDNDRCLEAAQLDLHVEQPMDKLARMGSAQSLFAIEKKSFVFRCDPPDLSLCAMTLEAMIADSLQLLLDEVKDQIKDQILSGEALYKAALPVLRKTLHASLPIEGRGERSFRAYGAWKEKGAARVFEGILSESELLGLYEMKVKQFVGAINRKISSLSAAESQMALALEIQKLQSQTEGMGWEAKGRVFCELIAPKLDQLYTMRQGLQ